LIAPVVQLQKIKKLHYFLILDSLFWKNFATKLTQVERRVKESLCQTNHAKRYQHLLVPYDSTRESNELWRRTLSHNSPPPLPDSVGFLGRTGPSQSYPLWTVSTSLPRLQPSFVLLPMQD